MKMNLKINLKNNLSRVPLQMIINEKNQFERFTQFDDKSLNKGIKEICKIPFFKTNINTDSISTP